MCREWFKPLLNAAIWRFDFTELWSVSSMMCTLRYEALDEKSLELQLKTEAGWKPRAGLRCYWRIEMYFKNILTACAAFPFSCVAVLQLKTITAFTFFTLYPENKLGNAGFWSFFWSCNSDLLFIKKSGPVQRQSIFKLHQRKREQLVFRVFFRVSSSAKSRRSLIFFRTTQEALL